MSKKAEILPYDWSADGKSLLISQPSREHQRYEIWILGIGSDQSARKTATDPAQDLFQSHFSPDGRGIVFEATRHERVQSTIFAMRTMGGTMDSHH